jgi:signal peptidase I
VSEKYPSRGDIIAFRRPGGSHGDSYTKRVIGLPGDRIILRAGIPIINGHESTQVCGAPTSGVSGIPITVCRETLPEGLGGASYNIQRMLSGGVTREILGDAAMMYLDDTTEYIVPQGHLFAIGDNRDDSVDSRFPRRDGDKGVGFIPIENLMGRFTLVIASWNSGVDVEDTHKDLVAAGLRRDRILSRLR